jgi:hypothetical protein
MMDDFTARQKVLRILVSLVALLLISAAPLLNSQPLQQQRLGRPLDWSHAHLVASRGGPDHGLSIYADWRTLFRHMEIDQAQAARKRAEGGQARNSAVDAMSLGLPGLALFGILLFRRGSEKRRFIACWFLVFLITCLAFHVACGGSGPVAENSPNPPGNINPPSPTSTPDLKLDWSLNTGGLGGVMSFPAKFSFSITTSSCTDVIYFTVNQAGGPSTVNLIAITNPYAGCPGNPAGTTPTVKFGIAMTFGTTTSPVLSLDGTVLYVFESRPRASGGLILHAINVNNIAANPGTYNFGTGTWTSVHTLAAPTGLPGSEQLFEFTFAGVGNNESSPYLDYANNQIFFGDSGGRIRRVVNTNITLPNQDTTNFPVACGTSPLQAPVFVNGQVIVTSTDGTLYRINAMVAPPLMCVASAAVGDSGSGPEGQLASPVIDVTNSKIIVTTGLDFSGNRSMSLFALNFAAGAAPLSSVTIGPDDANIFPQIPAFDHAFFMTNNGNLYVGGEPAAGCDTYLIRVPYSGTTLGAPAGFAELQHTGGIAPRSSSAVTAFLTASLLPNPDFIYVGGAGGTYRFMNRIASGFAGTDAAPVAMDGFFALPGGSNSGIIISNRTGSVTGAGATANIYFGTLGVAATSTESTVVQLAQQF